jgi:hypothetical protein
MRPTPKTFSIPGFHLKGPEGVLKIEDAAAKAKSAK